MMPAPAKPLRVAIADDHALFRQGLISLLGMRDDVSVVAETDCAEAIQPMVAATPCDILLLDLQMERSSLIDIAAVSPQTDVIVVTASEGVESAPASNSRATRFAWAWSGFTTSPRRPVAPSG